MLDTDARMWVYICHSATNQAFSRHPDLPTSLRPRAYICVHNRTPHLFVQEVMLLWSSSSFHEVNLYPSSQSHVYSILFEPHWSVIISGLPYLGPCAPSGMACRVQITGFLVRCLLCGNISGDSHFSRYQLSWQLTVDSGGIARASAGSTLGSYPRPFETLPSGF